MKPTTIVTGIPRSGTSLTMKILNDGGIPAIYDPKIHADINPYGSFEARIDTIDFTKTDGKCVKVLGAQQIFNLPKGQYKVIMPVRDPEQIILSRKEAFKQKNLPPNMEKQKTMLEIQYEFTRFVVKNMGMELLEIPYDDYFNKSEEVVDKISAFVGGLDKDKALKAIDKNYYKIRK